MADNEEGKEAAPRGHEWEVVSLTASAYAAAPGPKQVDQSVDNQSILVGEHEAETSNAMFLSGHFVFPPSQHENLPVETEYNEMHNEKGNEDDVSQLVKEEGVKSDVKDGENVTIKGLMSEEFPGIHTLSISVADIGKDVSFEKVQSIYSSAEFDSFDSETNIGKPNYIRDGEETDESIEPLDRALDSGLPNFQKPVEGDKYDEADLPCEAWWKRRAFSLYANAKEANTFWSIFIAAAVMGLVIIGHQWQKERWQVLQLKWHLGLNDERMGRMLGPISRVKDVMVGGHRRGSLVRGSTSA